MPVSAVSYLARHVTDVRTMVARASTFQAALPVVSEASALLRVHLGFRPYDDDELRPADFPFVVVGTDRDQWEKYAAGVGPDLKASGDIAVDFYVGSKYDNAADSYTAALNLIHGTIADIVGQQGRDGLVAFESINASVSCRWSGTADSVGYWFHRAVVRWGVV